MRGTVAKRIRRDHYGDRPIRLRGYDTAPNGQIFSDDVRYLYQQRKEVYKRGREK